ncbi:MAG: hypothetical protein GY852_06655 [bacterium]|nr:hypothetical protein [bacterium]
MKRYQLTRKQFEKLMGEKLPISYVASVTPVRGSLSNAVGKIFSGEREERVAKLEIEVNKFGRERYTITVELPDKLLLDGLKAVNAKKLPEITTAKKEVKKKLARR